LIHAIHVIQRKKYPSHISSMNQEAKKPIIYLQYRYLRILMGCVRELEL